LNQTQRQKTKGYLTVGTMGKKSIFEKRKNKLIRKLEERTQKSARMDESARQYLPGGDTRTAVFFKPYPLYVAKGKASRFYDIDGNEYLDFLNNFTALIHGHAHPAVADAACDQIKKGSSFAAPTKSQYELAELICQRVKSVEQVRFCNTGTEATMNAIRAARLLTGKSSIVKMEGGYHGTHDLGEVSFDPGLDAAGPIEAPCSVPPNRGIPESVLKEIIVVPFNNKTVAEKIIRHQHDQIACVIVEPMLGAAGCVPPADDYLKFLRSLTRDLGILLIFDEVVTFRLSIGGAQQLYGIEPDITAFGKIIGGGFPIGAFGGPSEIMKIYSPQEKEFISQSGTFNGNPVTMEAGIACLKALNSKVLEHINSLGRLFRKGVNSAFQKVGIRGQSTGIGSLSCIHFNSETIKDYRSVVKGNFPAMELVHLELLLKGINIPRRGGECSISTPMTETDIVDFLTAFEEALADIKPFIEESTPELIM
jgi:glutamate-1-semialdehyde 2,1-aminomutase